jgi:hypothetical protein
MYVLYCLVDVTCDFFWQYVGGIGRFCLQNKVTSIYNPSYIGNTLDRDPTFLNVDF